MQVAQKRDAVKSELFWFKKDILTCVSPPQATECCKQKIDQVYVPMTIDLIINGKVCSLFVNNIQNVLLYFSP